MAAESAKIGAAAFPEILEAPRYSCALAGAYSTALGVFGTVPILHSGMGAAWHNCRASFMPEERMPEGRRAGPARLARRWWRSM